MPIRTFLHLCTRSGLLVLALAFWARPTSAQSDPVADGSAPSAADAGEPAQPAGGDAASDSEADSSPAEPPASDAPAPPLSEGEAVSPPLAPAEAPPAPSPELPEQQASPSAVLEPAARASKPVEAIEVTVAGTRVARTAGSAHILRKKELERFEHDDPHAILMQVPGVYMRQEDGMGLRPNIGIRGANPDRSKKITLMEDGVLFGPAPYSAPAAYYFPLVTRMAAIRVLKGPSALTSGPQTIGGAIDFATTSAPTRTTGAVDVGGGEYGYGKAHVKVGTGTEQFGFLLEGVHLQNSGFMELPSGAETGSTRNDWMVKAHYVLDPSARVRNELGVKLSYADELSKESYLGLTDADFRADPYRRYPAAALDKMTNHRTSVVLSHLASFERHDLQIKTQAYRHDYTRSWRKLNGFRAGAISPYLRDPDDPENRPFYAVLTGEDSSNSSEQLLIGPNHREYVSQGVQSVLSASVQSHAITHRVEAGIRLHHDSIDRLHTQDAFRMQGGVPVLVPDQATETTTSNTAASYALAMHVVDAMTWRDLTLTPGVRLEVIAGRTRDRLTRAEDDGLVVAAMPGVGLYYAILDELGLLAGVYRGFSPPPPASDNKPEYSVNYEAGARFSAGKARLEAIGFYNDYSNITSVCSFSAGCLDQDLDRQADGGEARVYGVEVSGGHEIPLGPLKLPIGVAYTYSRGEFLSDFESQDPIWGAVENGDAIPYLPRHQTSAMVGLESPRAGGSLALSYVAALLEEPSSGSLAGAWKTDRQLWIDLEAHVRVVGPLVLYGNVRNLANAEYIVGRRPYGARVNAPRWIQVGAKVSF